MRAHRAAWVLINGTIPDGTGYHGMCVAHRCDNRGCVNPLHLFLATQSDNLADMYLKGRCGDRGKLTPNQVSRIRDMYSYGNHTYKSLASMYHCFSGTIGHVIRGTEAYREAL